MKRQKTAIVVGSVACVVVLCSTIHAGGIFGKRSGCKKADPCPAGQYAGNSGYYPTSWRPWPPTQPSCYGTADGNASAEKPATTPKQTPPSTPTGRSALPVFENRRAGLVAADEGTVSLAHTLQSESAEYEAILILPVE